MNLVHYILFWTSVCEIIANICALPGAIAEAITVNTNQKKCLHTYSSFSERGWCHDGVQAVVVFAILSADFLM